MIEKLKKLGLSGYEAQAYISLLELGDAEAHEIANNANIPMGRIYNVLSSLENLNLIRCQDTRPKKYTCVDPSTAIRQLFKRKHKEMQETLEELGAIADDLSSELSKVVARKPDRTFWTVAIGDKSLDLVRECISSAREEVLFFLASRITSESIRDKLIKGKYSAILKTLHDALKRGVKVKVIFSKDVNLSLIEKQAEIQTLIMQDRLGCRFAEIPATPFNIIDGVNVLLNMQNPLDPEEIFAVVNVRDKELAVELRKRFFAIWEKAYEYNFNRKYQNK